MLATAPADSAETFTVSQRHSALYDTVGVAGGGPSVHVCAVFFGAESRDGDKLGQTPITVYLYDLRSRGSFYGFIRDRVY